jgi:hypothetical protein
MTADFGSLLSPSAVPQSGRWVRMTGRGPQCGISTSSARRFMTLRGFCRALLGGSFKTLMI